MFSSTISTDDIIKILSVLKCKYSDYDNKSDLDDYIIKKAILDDRLLLMYEYKNDYVIVLTIYYNNYRNTIFHHDNDVFSHDKNLIFVYRDDPEINIFMSKGKCASEATVITSLSDRYKISRQNCFYKCDDINKLSEEELFHKELLDGTYYYAGIYGQSLDTVLIYQHIIEHISNIRPCMDINKVSLYINHSDESMEYIKMLVSNTQLK